MAHRDHSLARKLISDALDRFAAQEHEQGDAELIVLGALLETIEDRHSGFIIISISRRLLASMVGLVAAGVSVLAYAKQWGFG